MNHDSERTLSDRLTADHAGMPANNDQTAVDLNHAATSRRQVRRRQVRSSPSAECARVLALLTNR